MDDDQQFCLRWNNHQSTLISVFDTLLEKGIHVDCTLAAEGQTLKAHKVVLSACSPYFENVLSQQYDKHPIIILKDVKYAELRAMMDYMYRGEVNISQDQLAALLKAAESLQIKGLSDNKPARPPGTHTSRQPSPSTKMSEGSVGSREGSASPSRRRKKARRASTDGIIPTVAPVPSAPVTVNPPAPLPPQPLPADEHATADLPPTECKVEEGSRGAEGEGVEDLTLDEENEEPLPSHNDVVRNFQWHMERSQDELMNVEGARDSQGSAAGKNGDLPTIIPKKVIAEKPSSTFAVLRNVVLPNEDVLSSKFEDEEIDDNKNDVKLPLIPDEELSNVITPIKVPKPAKLNVKASKSLFEVKPNTEEKIVKKRGRPPLNKNKNVAADRSKEDGKGKTHKPIQKTPTTKRGQDEKKQKETKKSKSETEYERDKVKVADVIKKKKDDSDTDNKTSVYDFDLYNSEPNVPLPCSEYKTEKGYKCPNCERCYNARKNLVRHVTLECGRDPQYQCPHCPYSKHRRNELKKHIQKKHSNEPERAIKRKTIF